MAKGGAGRGGEYLEARGKCADVVAVAHPDPLAPSAVEEPSVEERQTVRVGGDVGAAVFYGVT